MECIASQFLRLNCNFVTEMGLGFIIIGLIIIIYTLVKNQRQQND